MLSYEELVISAVVNQEGPRRDLLATALLQLNEEHFVGIQPKTLFRMLKRYYDRTGEVLPQDVLTQALQASDLDSAKILSLTKLYEALAFEKTSVDKFQWAVDELKAAHAKRQTGLAITQAMEILERGWEVNRQFLQGHEDARSYLNGRLHEIDKAVTQELAPEGNIFIEKENILADYESRKNNKDKRGILTGIRCIDDYTDGWQRGELILVVAYAGMGKSMISTQASWNCAVVQKKNCFFATSETLRPQVMRRILARHSRLPMFGKPDGINSADIKKGTLSAADEKIFRDVTEDWYYNKDYGQLNVVQIPPHSKLSYVENRLREWSTEVDVSLGVMDYLALLEAEVRRGSEREEFNEIIRGAKGIAQGFHDGQGIPFVSPWQIRRESYESALRNGYYTKAALSDTSEAEKSADQIIALLREEDNNRDMRLQFLKMRDDDIPPIQQVSIDLRSTYIGTHLGPQSLAPGGSSAEDLMSMIA